MQVPPTISIPDVETQAAGGVLDHNINVAGVQDTKLNSHHSPSERGRSSEERGSNSHRQPSHSHHRHGNSVAGVEVSQQSNHQRVPPEQQQQSLENTTQDTTTAVSTVDAAVPHTPDPHAPALTGTQDNPKTIRGCNFAVTIFDAIPRIINENGIRYYVYQKEQCPTTGRYHYQAYFQFFKRLTIQQIKTMHLPDLEGRIEQAKGSAEANYKYCTKECTPEMPVGGRVPGTSVVEHGNRLQQGQRIKNAQYADNLARGIITRDDLLDHAQNFMQNPRGTEAILQAVEKKMFNQFRTVTVFTYYGESGTGKTLEAVYNAGDPLSYFRMPVPKGDVWWDGYDPSIHKVLILDEYNGWMQLNMLKQVLDGYPLRIEIKGGQTYAAWTTVYITSNTRPHDWYPNICKGDWEALVRRLNTGGVQRWKHERDEQGDMPSGVLYKESENIATQAAIKKRVRETADVWDAHSERVRDQFPEVRSIFKEEPVTENTHVELPLT